MALNNALLNEYLSALSQLNRLINENRNLYLSVCDVEERPFLIEFYQRMDKNINNQKYICLNNKY